jgi:hypothetical protein
MPGSGSLDADVERLRTLHRSLRNAFNKPDEWDTARRAYVGALDTIRRKLREISVSRQLPN